MIIEVPDKVRFPVEEMDVGPYVFVPIVIVLDPILRGELTITLLPAGAPRVRDPAEVI